MPVKATISQAAVTGRVPEQRVPERLFLIEIQAHLDPTQGAFLRAAAILAKSGGEARFVYIAAAPERQTSELKTLTVELGHGDKRIWLRTVQQDMPAAY